MFLNLLNEREKKIFLKLAVAVIQADEKIEESEKKYIEEYSREMGLSDYDLTEKIDAMELASEIGKNSTEIVKRIFLVELTACANADGEFAEAERNLINSFVRAFGLSDLSLEKSLSLLADYIKASSALMKFVEEGL